MANEITERGQFATYGGPQLTLAGSDLASKVDSILTRSGSGTGRGWLIFDSSSPYNSFTVIKPGDMVLVNPKSTPMDFPVQTAAGGGGLDSIILGGPSGETQTEYEDDFRHTSAATTSVNFSDGAGTVQYSTDNSNWSGLPSTIPANTRYYLRVLHPNSASFSVTITLTYA